MAIVFGMSSLFGKEILRKNTISDAALSWSLINAVNGKNAIKNLQGKQKANAIIGAAFLCPDDWNPVDREEGPDK